MSYTRRPRKSASLDESLRESRAGLAFYSKLFDKAAPDLPGRAPRIPRKRAPVRAAVPSEHYEQTRYVTWFRRTYPTVLIFAIPNGGIRDAVTAFRLKQEGVEPDVPDLFVPAFRFWVEMKRIGGDRRRSQREMAEYLIRLGYQHIFGMGFEAAKAETLNRFPPGDYPDEITES